MVHVRETRNEKKSEKLDSDTTLKSSWPGLLTVFHFQFSLGFVPTVVSVFSLSEEADPDLAAMSNKSDGSDGGKRGTRLNPQSERAQRLEKRRILDDADGASSGSGSSSSSKAESRKRKRTDSGASTASSTASSAASSSKNKEVQNGNEATGKP